MKSKGYLCFILSVVIVSVFSSCTNNQEGNTEKENGSISSSLPVSSTISGNDGSFSEPKDKNDIIIKMNDSNIKPITVSIGDGHVAAITQNRDLYVWGDNLDGQIGNGNRDKLFNQDPTTPVKVLENVASVSLGYFNSAAITMNGDLYSWGSNTYETVGNGSTGDTFTPTKILEDVISVCFGTSHGAAITSDGSLYMWGDNQYGQLGNGKATTSGQATPVKIMDNVASVSLRGAHSAAITKDGSLYMWGDNQYGQIGNGTEKKQTTPLKVLENVSSIDIGEYHSAAITLDGSLYIWGDDFHMDSTTGGRWRVSKRRAPEKILSDVVSVSLGDYHYAAITRNKDLYVWGDNGFGQAAGQSMGYQSKPAKIMSDVISVDLGSFHSSAITADKSLYMWGRNDKGQLGNGNTNNISAPAKILDDVLISLLSTNNNNYNDGSPNFSLAVKENGTLYVWGENSQGQVGNGSIFDKDEPFMALNNVLVN